MYFTNSHIQGDSELEFYYGNPGDPLRHRELDADALGGRASQALIAIAGFVGDLAVMGSFTWFG